MISRYTRPEMVAVWSEQRKLDTWLQVELAVVEALAQQGVVPEEDAARVRERASFTVEAVKEREKVTDHDVAAFVDVVDTALALQIQAAGRLVMDGVEAALAAVVRRAEEHRRTVTIGRSHAIRSTSGSVAE